MKDKRPVNLDIGTIQLPLPAYVSILHRASGVFIFAGTAVLLYMLDASLQSADSFASLQECFSSFFAKLIIWGVLAGVIYHSVAGLKHLLMDLGIGESLEGGLLGARITVGLSAILIIIAGLLIW